LLAQTPTNSTHGMVGRLLAFLAHSTVSFAWFDQVLSLAVQDMARGHHCLPRSSGVPLVRPASHAASPPGHTPEPSLLQTSTNKCVHMFTNWCDSLLQ